MQTNKRLKIGIIDRWFDNWHTNYYPGFIRDTAKSFGFNAEILYAYADMNAPERCLSNAQWIENLNNGGFNITLIDSYDEIIEKSDALMVMSADDCLCHEELSRKALMSGKPVFCDKTFAPSYDAAVRMFELAEKYNTPVFTTSANRYCSDLVKFFEESNSSVIFCGTTGPGDMLNYSIHQIEVIEAVMGTDIKSCTAFKKLNSRHAVFEYTDGRIATFTQCEGAAYETFNLLITREDGSGRKVFVGDYYTNLMKAMLGFFETGTSPVTKADTLTVMAMQETVKKALLSTGERFEIKSIN